VEKFKDAVMELTMGFVRRKNPYIVLMGCFWKIPQNVAVHMIMFHREINVFQNIQTNPKTISLTYVLRGNKKSFNWEVYKGLNDYVAGITRTISYSEDEREPTSKDFVLKNIDNSKQKELLIPFVDKIDSLSNNKDNRARIAISIIQNIPYDYSDKLKGRYAYQALYDNEGVCGEKSRLLASILREMGYGVALIDYENFGLSHEAVGIKCPLKYSYR